MRIEADGRAFTVQLETAEEERAAEVALLYNFLEASASGHTLAFTPRTLAYVRNAVIARLRALPTATLPEKPRG